MSNDTSIEVISTLLKRRDLMEEIVSGPVRRTDLCGELELSRSTIYRGLDQLAELGLVMDQTGTYESTKYGSMIYDKYLEFEKFVSKLSISQNLVETIYSLEPSPPQSTFLEGTIYPSNQYIPAENLKLLEQTIVESTCIRCVTPTVYPEIISALQEHARNGKMAGNILLSNQAFRYLSEQFKEGIKEMPGGWEISVCETGATPPISLYLTQSPEESVTIATYGDAGGIREVIKTRDPRAVSWAEEYISSLKRKSATIV